MNCPLCSSPMKIEKYEGVEIDVCTSCQSVWLDQGELGKITKTMEEEFTPEQIIATLDETSRVKNERKLLLEDFLKEKLQKGEEATPDEIMNLFKSKWGRKTTPMCPKCNSLMEEFNYAGTGIMVDRCKKGHGFILDAKELDKVQIMIEHHQRKNAPVAPPKGMLHSDKKCPACNIKLFEKEYEKVLIDVCSKCGGIWLDRNELLEIVKRREKVFTEAEKNAPQSHPTDKTELLERLKCPKCTEIMARSAYAYSSGIIIDRCKHGHGTWLDKGELEKIQIYAEGKENASDEELEKYRMIFTQATSELMQERKRNLQSINVSRLDTINRVVRWFSKY